MNVHPGGVPVTPEELAEIEKRVTAATPGAWTYYLGVTWQIWARTDDEHQFGTHVAEVFDDHDGNAVLIAHAKQDLTRLLAEVGRLTAALTDTEQQRDEQQRRGDAAVRALADLAAVTAGPDMAESFEYTLVWSPDIGIEEGYLFDTLEAAERSKIDDRDPEDEEAEPVMYRRVYRAEFAGPWLPVEETAGNEEQP